MIVTDVRIGFWRSIGLMMQLYLAALVAWLVMLPLFTLVWLVGAVALAVLLA